MKTCYIFAAALGKPENFAPRDGDLIIAADAGLLTLKEMGFTPHLTVGDFDSLKEIPNDGEVIKHPIKKDDTDTALGVKIGLERGFKRFCLYGCAGKRLDHTVANLQILSFIAQNGGQGFLYGEDFTATAINETTLSLPPESNGTISIFAATSECEISLKGLLYPLDHARITFDFPLGVSNEFIGEAAQITVHKGTALVIINTAI